MQIEKHIFDIKSRVSAEEVAAMELAPWLPPIVNAAGNLVHAETRPAQKLGTGSGDGASKVDETDAAVQEQCEQAKARGYQEGLAQGKQEGAQQAQKQAQQQMQAQLQPRLQELNILLTTLSHSLNEEDYKLEQTLFTLVKQIAEAVIGHEMKTDPGKIMKVIRDTLAALPPNRDHVRIRLNPADKTLADDAIKEGGENWHVIADEDIARGGCVIETEQSTADFSIEDRLASVLEQLEEQQATCPKPGDPDYEEAPEPAVSARVPASKGAESIEEAAEDSDGSEAVGENPAIPDSDAEAGD